MRTLVTTGVSDAGELKTCTSPYTGERVVHDGVDDGTELFLVARILSKATSAIFYSMSWAYGTILGCFWMIV